MICCPYENDYVDRFLGSDGSLVVTIGDQHPQADVVAFS